MALQMIHGPVRGRVPWAVVTALALSACGGGEEKCFYFTENCTARCPDNTTIPFTYEEAFGSICFSVQPGLAPCPQYRAQEACGLTTADPDVDCTCALAHRAECTCWHPTGPWHPL